MSGTGFASSAILCLLFATFAVVLKPPVDAGANFIRVPEDYHTIQEALDNANNGDTVLVHSRTYREILRIDKAVLLIGEDRITTVIQGFIEIHASHVLLSNFTVQGYTDAPNAIYVGSSNNTLKNNIIWSSGYSAVSLSGGDLSKYNTIQGNDILTTHLGIQVDGSNGNLIDGNRILYNEWGISLRGSSYNTVVDNKIANNTVGVLMHSTSCNNTVAENWLTNNSSPIYLTSGSSSNVVVGNNITNNDSFGVELTGSSGCSVLRNYIVNNNGGIHLGSSTDNLVRGNVINDNGDEWGIWIQTPVWSSYYSSGNVIAENSVTNMGRGHGGAIKVERSTANKIMSNEVCNCNLGIEIGNESSENVILCNNIDNSGSGVCMWGSGNTVIGNTISDNVFGIQLFGSSTNMIHHNSLINNTSQAFNQDPSCSNVWDSGYPSGGNYWSDFSDLDLFSGLFQNETGSDDIWDHPYVINVSNQDRYPLVRLFKMLPSDLNFDGVINKLDLSIVAEAFGSKSGDPNWNEAADIDKNGVVNIVDVSRVGKDYGRSA